MNSSVFMGTRKSPLLLRQDDIEDKQVQSGRPVKWSVGWEQRHRSPVREGNTMLVDTETPLIMTILEIDTDTIQSGSGADVR
jgi:hypothetical protein